MGRPQTSPVAAGQAVGFVVGWEGVTAGELATVPRFTAGFRGTFPGSSFQLPGGGSNPDHTTIESGGTARFTPITVAGDVYTATRVLRFDTGSDAGYEGIQFNWPAGVKYFLRSGFCTFNIKGTNGGAQAVDLIAANDGDECFWQVRREDVDTGRAFLAPHPTAGTPGSGIRVWLTTDKVYIETRRVGSLLMFFVLDADGNWIGSADVGTTDAEIPFEVYWDYLGHGDFNSMEIEPQAYSVAAIPVAHHTPTIPAPDNAEAEQTGADEVTVRWDSTCCRFKLEASDDAGASWTTLDAYAGNGSANVTLAHNSRALTRWEFVHGGLNVSESWTYRITPVYGDEGGAQIAGEPATTDPVTLTAVDPLIVSVDSVGSNRTESGTPHGIWVQPSTTRTVSQLGFFVKVGGSQGNRTIRVYNNAGTEIGSVTVDTTGVADLTFRWGLLSSPLTFTGGQKYYLLADPAGSWWCDNPTLTLAPGWTVGGAYRSGGANFDWAVSAYIPINLKFS